VSTHQAFTVCDLLSAKPLWKMEGMVPLSIAPGKNTLALFRAAGGKGAPAAGKTLELLETATGKELWRAAVAGGVVTFADGLISVKTAAELLALQPRDGRVLWRRALPANTIWRRPIIAEDSVLLVNDMSNEVVAFAGSDGEVRYRRDLRDGLLCDPIVISPQRVVFHSLRMRTVTLQCLDVPTGRLAWESGLSKAAQSAGGAPPVRLGGLGLSPLVWRGCLLHLDLARHCIWPVRMDGGAVCAPVDLSAALGGKLGEEISSWGVTGETLYLLGKTGCVALLRLLEQ